MSNIFPTPLSLVDTMGFPILILVTIFNLLLINLVYKNNKKSATNIIFVVLSLIISLWLIILALDRQFSTNLYLARLSIFFAASMNCAFFLLAYTLPSEHFQLKKKHLYILLGATAVVMLLAVSPYTFTGIETSSGVRSVVPGFGMAVFALFTFSMYSLAIRKLFQKWKLASGVAKRQLQLMWIGILTMIGLLIITVMIPVIFFKNNTFIVFAPVYTLIFLSSTAVSILKYHMFNIKVLATETLVTVLVTMLLFEGLFADSLTQIIYKISFATVMGILGIFVVRSVQKEVKQREQVASLAESLETANLRLQELDRQKTEFLSIASHQLRTPLSIIKGYLELIRDGAYGKISTKMIPTLDNMDESNERLIHLIDEFLNISRIEQGRTKFTFDTHQLNDTVTSVVEELEERAKDKGMKITWKPDDKLPAFTMDEEKIRNVVFNFVDNAIKYSEKGTVDVTVDQDDGSVVVRVKDQGLGFNKEDEANFYQKFYRGKNVEGTNVNGTGLGLFVCRKFIESHGGRVWAKSPGLGKGSEFGFQIPMSTSAPKTFEVSESTAVKPVADA